MKQKQKPKQNPRSNRFQIISGLGVLVVGIFLVGSLAEARARSSAEGNLVDAGRYLYRSLEGYRATFGGYPSNGDPLEETFDPGTLEPLVREGEILDSSRVLDHLKDERISVYCTPDLPTRNHDFWAVLVSKESPRVKVLIADTDQYPGREGDRLRGVYVLRAGYWVSRGH